MMERRRWPLCALLASVLGADALLHTGNTSMRRLDGVASSCNLTLYQQWLDEPYEGRLSADPRFWIYQTQPQIVLNNFLALKTATRFCIRQFESLYVFRAGRMGPVDIQDGYKIMCRPYCLESDSLHQVAMQRSGCNCIELSTQPDEVAYKREGDWCYENSARLLCDMIGFCGVWQCDLSDFMCPRYEWNKKNIPYRGRGNCVRNAATTTASNSYAIFSILALMMSSLFLWLCC